MDDLPPQQDAARRGASLWAWMSSGALQVAVLATVATFIPLAVGLLASESPEPGRLWAFAGFGALLAGAITFGKAHTDARTTRRDQGQLNERISRLAEAARSADAVNDSLVKANAQLEIERERLTVERADVAGRLAGIADSMWNLASNSMHLESFVSQVVDRLFKSLSDVTPDRVMFLVQREWLPNPAYLDLPRDIGLADFGTCAGRQLVDRRWRIKVGSEDYHWAEQWIMVDGSKEQSFPIGSTSEFNSDAVTDVLRGPGGSSGRPQAWFRYGVVFKEEIFGLLCVDLSEQHEWLEDERTLVAAFGQFLSLGFHFYSSPNFSKVGE